MEPKDYNMGYHRYQGLTYHGKEQKKITTDPPRNQGLTNNGKQPENLVSYLTVKYKMVYF